MWNRLLYERTAAPDDSNTTFTTNNATSLRQKRAVLETTSTTIENDLAHTTELTTHSSVQTTINNLVNETFQYNDTQSNQSTSSNMDDQPSTSGSHPTFHVTYWMFYPYSQVK